MNNLNLARVGLALILLASSAVGAQAAAPQVRNICQADFQKLCPAAKPGRGAVMRCVKTRLSDVTADCKSAVTAAQERSAQRKAAKLAAAQTRSTTSAH
ncbi:MAG TPA: cysteine rich repeat-containing protein [Caulobacteraceae bacterium]